MARPNLIASTWPLVIVEWPAELDVHDIRDHFAELADLLDVRRGPLVVVVDGTEARMLHSTLRMRTAEGISAITARAVSRMLGVAYVAPSVVVRGAITAIHWVARPPFPSITMPTRPEALDWARARLRAAGLEIAEARTSASGPVSR